MRFLIGCSSAIAVVVFIICFAISLFVRDATWTDRLLMASTLSIITFVAALLLAMNDSAKRSTAMKSARKYILACSDMNDEDFVASLPFDDVALLLSTRKAISQFFNVPEVQISRNVHLIHDLHVDELEPSFQFFVVDFVIASQQTEPKSFGFSMAGLETIDDLAGAIRGVLNGLEQGTEQQHRDDAG